MSVVEPSIKQEEAPEPTVEAVELDTDISLEDWLRSTEVAVVAEPSTPSTAP